MDNEPFVIVADDVDDSEIVADAVGISATHASKRLRMYSVNANVGRYGVLTATLKNTSAMSGTTKAFSV
jgi:hypothetical protein